MRQFKRQSTPAVRNGKPLQKNRWERTSNYFYDEPDELIVDRRRAGKGFRHLVRRDDIRRFVRLLPDWDQLRIGLNAILLDSGGDCMGWHVPGVIALSAWESKIIWDCCTSAFFEGHREIFDKLNIPVEFSPHGARRVLFTPESAKAFQLVHVLVHELGHHHDRMTTRSQQFPARGEAFAEQYTRRHEDLIIDRYFVEFGSEM